MAVPVNALHANFDVDYVIVYRFTDTSMLLMHFCGASAHSHTQAEMRQTNILPGSFKLWLEQDFKSKSEMETIALSSC